MLAVNIPKEINRFCPKCNKHTIQKVSIYKAGKRRGTAAGERRHALRKKGYGGQKFPKLAKPAKTTKKLYRFSHAQNVRRKLINGVSESENSSWLQNEKRTHTHSRAK